MKRFLVPGSVLLFVLWLLAQQQGFFSPDTSFHQWRRSLIILSGVVSLFWLSSVMVLATRPAWLEQRLGGLDRLHKWAGIGGTLLVLSHWLLEKSPKLLLAATEGGHGGHGRPHGAGDFQPLKALAAHLGELSFYLMTILVVIALLRNFPYRLFRQLHRVFPVLFLAAAFHSVVLLPASAYAQPMGWLVLLIAVLGSLAALLCLTGRLGSRKRHDSQVSDVQILSDGTMVLELSRPTSWEKHRAGQFALVDFGHGDGAHPFTIVGASASRLRFMIKPLGDYTRTLANRLHVGDPLTIEGPYGCFVFDEAEGHQVWVAGGVGIAPFLARLEELVRQGKRSLDIDLFYANRATADQALPAGLEETCKQLGVRLHCKMTSGGGRFRSEDIQAVVQGGRSQVWFCGPVEWGSSLRRFLEKQGNASVRFHQELFKFR